MCKNYKMFFRKFTFLNIKEMFLFCPAYPCDTLRLTI